MVRRTCNAETNGECGRLHFAVARDRGKVGLNRPRLDSLLILLPCPLPLNCFHHAVTVGRVRRRVLQVAREDGFPAPFGWEKVRDELGPCHQVTRCA